MFELEDFTEFLEKICEDEILIQPNFHMLWQLWQNIFILFCFKKEISVSSPFVIEKVLNLLLILFRHSFEIVKLFHYLKELL